MEHFLGIPALLLLVPVRPDLVPVPGAIIRGRTAVVGCRKDAGGKEAVPLGGAPPRPEAAQRRRPTEIAPPRVAAARRSRSPGSTLQYSVALSYSMPKPVARSAGSKEAFSRSHGIDAIPPFVLAMYVLNSTFISFSWMLGP